MAKGKDTPAEATRLYSEVVKAKDVTSSCASDISPGLRMTSPEYPDGQRSSEAIVAGELTAVRESGTPTAKGLPGSTLTSIYSTPALKEGEENGDDQGEWTTVARKSRHGSPAKGSRHGSPERENPKRNRLGPEQENTVQEAIKQLTKEQRLKIHERQCVISIAGVKKPGTKSSSS